MAQILALTHTLIHIIRRPEVSMSYFALGAERFRVSSVGKGSEGGPQGTQGCPVSSSRNEASISSLTLDLTSGMRGN